MIPSLEVARRRGRSARVNSRFGQRGSICRTSSARGRVHCGARERRPRSVWIRGPGSPGRQKRLRPPSRLRPHLAPPRRQAQPRLASRQPPASPAPPFISCLRGGLAPDHEGLGEISQLLRIGLVSDDPGIASNAAETLEFWLAVKNGNDSVIIEVTIDLVREIGVIIATRRKAALIQALSIAKDVFTGRNKAHKEAIGSLCVHGLEFLAEELSYDVLRSEDTDVPLLRWGCTQLSVAMSRSGWHESDAVMRWIENSESDPLPEIRRVDSSDALHVGDR